MVLGSGGTGGGDGGEGGESSRKATLMRDRAPMESRRARAITEREDEDWRRDKCWRGESVAVIMVDRNDGK